MATALTILFATQLLLFTDFWISPASARQYCDHEWYMDPDPDRLVWLPYKTFCERFQTMPSNPSWFLIDDYPDDYLPNCKELGTVWVKEQGELYGDCIYVPVPGYTVDVNFELSLACNGNVSYPEKQYLFSAFSQGARQDFDIMCPGYPVNTVNLGVSSEFFVREPVGPGEVIEGKNLGTPACGLSAGNPINIATGNKFHSQDDAQLPSGLAISRYYNSDDAVAHEFGFGWRGRYSRQIKILSSGTWSHASLTRTGDDGSENYWRIEENVLKAPPDAKGVLKVAYEGNQIVGFTYVGNDGSIETYDDDGRLLSLVDRDGRILSFSYVGTSLSRVMSSSGRQLVYTHDPEGRVTSVQSSDGSAWKYFYSDTGNLSSVEFPGGASKAYHYEDTLYPHALTGETDENGHRTRTWAYDVSGRAILSTFGDVQSQVQRYGVSYGADGTSTTGPLQSIVDHTFETRHGLAKPGTASKGCGDCGNRIRNTTYDKRGNRDLITDFTGNVTDYDYSDENLADKVTYAIGTPEQFEISFTWDTNLRKPLRLTRGKMVTDYTYNARGQILTKRQMDSETLESRTWSIRYFEPPASLALVGKPEQVDGPRNDVADVTQYEYYTDDHTEGGFRAGDLKALINPLGHRVEFLKYDGNGRLLEYADANGVVTSIGYHPRGWRTSVTTAGATTRFEYDPAGNLVKSMRPDGTLVRFEYDSFHRLTAVEDAFGNRIAYTLDAAGNRVSERHFDAQGTLSRELERVYNSLNQLVTLIDGANGATGYAYDEAGNLASATDALSSTTRYVYDGLGRLVTVIDPMLGETVLEFDARNNPVSVTDPVGNLTRFTYDGLDNPRQGNSPDTGLASHEFDEAGNLTATTDSRGVRTEYVYDPINRLLEISYPDSTLDVRFAYDTGAYGTGRLSEISDGSGVTEYAYDPRGNVVRETRTIGSQTYVTSYSYNASDRLVQTVYPSGMIIDYELDQDGQIKAVRKGGASETETLISDVEYAPFGPVVSFTYGNGAAFRVDLDLDYRAAHLQSADLEWQLSHDPAGNIVAIEDLAEGLRSQSFSLDNLHRLESAFGDYGSLTFAYDANGNRTHFADGANERGYVYVPGSNLLAAQGNWRFTRDAAGNRIEKLDPANDGELYDYDDTNRLSQLRVRDLGVDTVAGTYLYNGRGQRVAKSASGMETHFIYGLLGQLLGEYSAVATDTFTEYVYLGFTPVAAISRSSEVIKPPARELIVDELDPGASSTGAWQNRKGGYDGNHHLAKKADGRTYRWTTTPPGEHYAIYAWWVDKKNQSDSVRYDIHDGQSVIDTVTRSHRAGGGQWQFLGEYRSAGGPNFVEVSSSQGKFVADAVRWVEIPEPVTLWNETTHFVHFDHLGTPRRVTDQNQTVVWRWDSTPFGVSQPDEDPDGNSEAFTLNLRFPGQYYDSESGLHYNYFRTYDPGIGRYIESDPIGLLGGLNAFEYAKSDPVHFFDSRGLDAELCRRTFYPYPIPYARHCYIRFTDGGSSSFGPKGTGADPAPDWWPRSCQSTDGTQDDKCVKKAMKNCKGEQYDFIGFNCCHCVEQAMDACGLSIPVKDWPNWPVNPGPQPGEPGYQPRPIYKGIRP